MRETAISFLCEACGGMLMGTCDNTIKSVVIDSRDSCPNSLFVAIIGEKNDGHDYWRSCLDNGCRAFLFSEKERAEEVLAVCPEASVVLTEDTSEAFKDMARSYLSQFPLIKIGVTGSVGKTTTRTLTAQVMSARYRTVSTQKNLNTHLGLCLTCFLADETTEAVVFEMGMDRRNDIAEYVEWVRPDAAIITNVGISHLERLGSREAIADAKLEITGRLAPGAPLVVNSDSDYLKPDEIRDRAPGDYNIISVTQGGAGDFIVDCKEDLGLAGIRFAVTDAKSGESVDFSMPLLGMHNALNAGLAIAMGMQYGISLNESARALSGAGHEKRRLNAEQCGGILLIDDSYNASPDSMCAGLAVLASVDAKRRVAVLGDMLELGSAEEEGHIRVGRTAAEKNIDLVIAVGRKTAYYAKGAEMSKGGLMMICLEDVGSALDMLDHMLCEGDAVLVKGSNSTGIAKAAEHIREKYKN